MLEVRGSRPRTPEGSSGKEDAKLQPCLFQLTPACHPMHPAYRAWVAVMQTPVTHDLWPQGARGPPRGGLGVRVSSLCPFHYCPFASDQSSLIYSNS